MNKNKFKIKILNLIKNLKKILLSKMMNQLLIY